MQAAAQLSSSLMLAALLISGGARVASAADGKRPALEKPKQ
jgi:hypothetical protein